MSRNRTVSFHFITGCISRRPVIIYCTEIVVFKETVNFNFRHKMTPLTQHTARTLAALRKTDKHLGSFYSGILSSYLSSWNLAEEIIALIYHLFLVDFYIATVRDCNVIAMPLIYLCIDLLFFPFDFILSVNYGMDIE